MALKTNIPSHVLVSHTRQINNRPMLGHPIGANCTGTLSPDRQSILSDPNAIKCTLLPSDQLQSFTISLPSRALGCSETPQALVGISLLINPVTSRRRISSPWKRPISARAGGHLEQGTAPWAEPADQPGEAYLPYAKLGIQAETTWST